MPSDVIVVLDEVYREFISDTDVPDGLDFFYEQNNVVVMRTFSKAYGLAGLRVGFAIAPEPIAEGMRKTALPFGVSSIAEDAVSAALECEDERFEWVRHLSQERDRVAWQALADQGWDIHLPRQLRVASTGSERRNSPRRAMRLESRSGRSPMRAFASAGRNKRPTTASST